MSERGKLSIVGMGPGDPDLLTRKAARVLGEAPVVAYFAKRGRVGHARGIAEGLLARGVRELRFEYPYTTEIAHVSDEYRAAMDCFYDKSAREVATALEGGADVALLCEGDPFLYGSAMYLFDRLGPAYRHEVIPGVSGMSACWSRAGVPIAHGDDVLSVLPGTLPGDELAARLGGGGAAVIMKVGRNLAKIREAARQAGVIDRAIYVERGSMAGEAVMKLGDVVTPGAPYFSMVLIPGRRGVR